MIQIGQQKLELEFVVETNPRRIAEKKPKKQ